MMYRMLGLGARELLYGRAEIAAELPERLAAVTPEQVRSAAAALRGERPRRTAGGARRGALVNRSRGTFLRLNRSRGTLLQPPGRHA